MKKKKNIKPQETIHNLRDNKVTDEHTETQRELKRKISYR